MSEEMLRSYEELRAEFSTACAELEKERERREKAESGYCEHRCQSLGIAECMNPEWENDRAERDMLREALDKVAEAAILECKDHGDPYQSGHCDCDLCTALRAAGYGGMI